MPDRPIIFSSAMVRALLDGRKTQTRRVLKPQPHAAVASIELHRSYPGEFVPWCGGEAQSSIVVPFAPGDRLWVREGFSRTDAGFAYMADHPGDPRGIGWRPSIHMPRPASRLTLTVTEVRVERLQAISEEDARAEGVHADTWGGVTPMLANPADACAHSAARPVYWAPGNDADDCLCFTARDAFAWLWNHIHGGDAWAANPWVAAISFTVERRNVDA